jgi:hypothetical protein
LQTHTDVRTQPDERNLSGRVASHPTIRYSTTGEAFTRLELEVPGGDKPIEVIARGALAEEMLLSVALGDALAVSGRYTAPPRVYFGAVGFERKTRQETLDLGRSRKDPS